MLVLPPVASTHQCAADPFKIPSFWVRQGAWVTTFGISHQGSSQKSFDLLNPARVSKQPGCLVLTSSGSQLRFQMFYAKIAPSR